MLYVCVGGLLLALAVFLLINRLGMLLVDKVYMSDDAVNQRKSEIYSDFSAYVKANGVSGRDSLSVAKWTDGQPFVTVVIFGRGADHRRFHNGKTEQENGVHSSYDYHNYGTLYLVRFEDGLYQVAISDSSDTRQRGIVRAASVFTAFFAFILLYMWYTRRLTDRIIKLSKDAAEVSSGELEKVISSDGSDEIAALAFSMDEMRRSVMQRMGNESRAWEANAELITAISHDIRTPMTSMLGYLGLLNDSGFEDKERCRQFTASAYAKAMDLKELTDELFRYFLVYGKAELELSLESYDGRLLLEQLLGEAEFDLIDSGFRVQRIEFKGECSVSADPLYLKRTLDQYDIQHQKIRRCRAPDHGDNRAHGRQAVRLHLELRQALHGQGREHEDRHTHLPQDHGGHGRQLHHRKRRRTFRRRVHAAGSGKNGGIAYDNNRTARLDHAVRFSYNMLKYVMEGLSCSNSTTSISTSSTSTAA